MAGSPAFRRDLYAATAADYDRHRPRYPPALIDRLAGLVPLDRTSRVLDLACGTGQIAFALAPVAGSVLAVDQEAGSVAFGRARAASQGVTNVGWLAARAEALPLRRPVDLVAIGNAFHRLDRPAAAAEAARLVRRGGVVALVWGDVPTTGDRAWQAAYREVLDRWRSATGADDRIPAGWRAAIEREPHDAVLTRAGLRPEGRTEVTTPHRWTVESLAGFAYSTSYLGRSVLGPQAGAFEADLRDALLAVDPAGEFHQDLSYAADLARRPVAGT